MQIYIYLCFFLVNSHQWTVYSFNSWLLNQKIELLKLRRSHILLRYIGDILKNYTRNKLTKSNEMQFENWIWRHTYIIIISLRNKLIINSGSDRK